MIYVYHKINIQHDRLRNGSMDLNKFCLVGIVDTDSTAQAFAWTNHIDTCWCSRREVEAIGARHRSTQVGDLFRIKDPEGLSDHWLRLESIGFTKLDVGFPGDLRHALIVNQQLENQRNNFNEVEQGWMSAYLQWAGTKQGVLKPV